MMNDTRLEMLFSHLAMHAALPDGYITNLEISLMKGNHRGTVSQDSQSRSQPLDAS